MASDSDDGTPTDGRLTSLTRARRWELLARSAVRISAVCVFLLVVYFNFPVGEEGTESRFVVLVVAGLAFLALLTFQVKKIVDSPVPPLRAAEALGTVVPLVIVAFALVYAGMSASDPEGFSEPITKVDGLYFAVTTLSTVGFGDIAPVTEGARIAVMVQMLVDLLIIGVLVKVIVGASRIGLERRRAEARSGSSSTAGGDVEVEE